MAVSSLQFAIFFSIVAFTYYLIKQEGRNWLLLLASYVFYFSWSWYFPIVLIALTGCTYFIGKQIKGKKVQSKRWLTTGIAINLLALAFFKYARFFIPEIRHFIANLGLPIRTDTLRILMPIGISYYVLQAISYLVDVYRRQMPASESWIDFAIYLAYFPKLVAGPIERARSFLPKLAQPKPLDHELLSKSFSLIVLGLVRKIVIADSLAVIIPIELFEKPSSFTPFELVFWLAAYAFRIYNDFAGYTDLARGISGFLGIELSRNFANPFFSRNFHELWNSWHITLSHWLRDYVFFPISRSLYRRSRNRNNFATLTFPTFMTMLSSGLWHGAEPHYLFWGAVMGLLLVAERIWTLRGPVVSPDSLPVWRQALAAILIFILMILAIVPFATGISHTLHFWYALSAWKGFSLPDSRLLLFALPALMIDWFQHHYKDELIFTKWPLPFRSFALAVALLAIFLFSRSHISEPFVYQEF